MHHSIHVEVKGQLVGIDSLLQSCVFGGLSSGYRDWQHVLLLADPLSSFLTQVKNG